MKTVNDLVATGKYTMDEALAIATKGSKGVVADVQDALTAGKVTEATWLPFLRATAAEHGEQVNVVTTETLKETYGEDTKNHPKAMEIIEEREKTEAVPDGIYQIGSETIRIEDGVKTQLK